MSLHLGLDLGATYVKWVALDASLQPVANGRAETHGERGGEAVAERLVDVARHAVERVGPVASIGIGVPGLYDRARGTTRFITNVPDHMRDVQVRDRVADALGVPTDLINDARAFALAESVLGAGRGHDVVVCLTLGSGVGGGVVVGGRLHEGLDGQAGELGHQTVDPRPDAPLCNCGNRGCAEAVFRAEGLGPGSPDEAYERAGAALGIVVANAVLTLTPDRIVVGGGVAVGAGERLLAPIRRTVEQRVRVAPIREIVPAELGGTAGAIGAALRGAGR